MVIFSEMDSMAYIEVDKSSLNTYKHSITEFNLQTSNLDGETNLKIRQALPNTTSFTTLETLSSMNAEVECEAPSRNVNEV